MRAGIYLGTAGWAIPKAHSQSFPERDSGLLRYAAVFNAAEINSTFYRAHRPSTFERWRDSVPDDFRFSVKVPKAITHELRLMEAGSAFAAFVSSLSGLGDRLGPLLLQLPPKLSFDAPVVEAFLRDAKRVSDASLVVEPRHPSWFTEQANELMVAWGIARAGADPERCPGALDPGGARHLTYLRLHGSPHVYFSSYEEEFIKRLAIVVAGTPRPTWCIFDNTASGAAAGDALRLTQQLGASGERRPNI